MHYAYWLDSLCMPTLHGKASCAMPGSLAGCTFGCTIMMDQVVPVLCCPQQLQQEQDHTDTAKARIALEQVISSPCYHS
jgi:hypothetical protein